MPLARRARDRRDYAAYLPLIRDPVALPELLPGVPSDPITLPANGNLAVRCHYPMPAGSMKVTVNGVDFLCGEMRSHYDWNGVGWHEKNKVVTLTRVTADEPGEVRLGVRGPSNPAEFGYATFAVSPKFTNLITDTEDFTTWTGDAVVTPNVMPGPGEVIESADAVAEILRQWDIPPAVGSYVGSVYVAKKTGVTDWMTWRVRLAEGTVPVNGSMSFNSQTGQVAWTTSRVRGFGVEDINADWWRIWLSLDNLDIGNTKVNLRLRPGVNSDGSGTSDPVVTNSETYWGVNFGRGEFPGDYQVG